MKIKERKDRLHKEVEENLHSSRPRDTRHAYLLREKVGKVKSSGGTKTTPLASVLLVCAIDRRSPVAPMKASSGDKWEEDIGRFCENHAIVTAVVGHYRDPSISQGEVISLLRVCLGLVHLGNLTRGRDNE